MHTYSLMCQMLPTRKQNRSPHQAQPSTKTTEYILFLLNQLTTYTMHTFIWNKETKIANMHINVLSGRWERNPTKCCLVSKHASYVNIERTAAWARNNRHNLRLNIYIYISKTKKTVCNILSDIILLHRHNSSLKLVHYIVRCIW